MKYFIGGFIIVLLFIQCSSKKEYDGVSLSKEFYELNKDNSFDYFKNKEILTSREYSIYNPDNQRNDRIPVIALIYLKDTFVIIPTYKDKADQKEREVFFNRCDSLTLDYLNNKYHNNSDMKSLFDMYQFEVDSLYQEYTKVIVPKELPYNNIPIRGRKDYIDFILLDVEEGPSVLCYLVLDSLDEYDSKRILHLPQLADNWYYRITK